MTVTAPVAFERWPRAAIQELNDAIAAYLDDRLTGNAFRARVDRLVGEHGHPDPSRPAASASDEPETEGL